MKIKWDGEGYNGIKTIMILDVYDIPSDQFFSGIKITDNSTVEIIGTTIATSSASGIVTVVLEMPQIDADNYDHIAYPDGGFFDTVVITNDTLGNPVQTSFPNTFIISKYASIHTLRTFFSIQEKEIDMYKMYNAIRSTKDMVDTALTQYIVNHDIDWEIGSIPQPIAELHNYLSAKYILQTSYPNKSDKLDTLESLSNKITQDIIMGKLTIDNINPIDIFTVANGDD